jgi:toxin YoeB
VAARFLEVRAERRKRTQDGGLKPNAQALLELLARDPYEVAPPYEKPVGTLSGACSRRISIQQRLVYQIVKNGKSVKVLRLWSHYE